MKQIFIAIALLIRMLRMIAFCCIAGTIIILSLAWNVKKDTTETNTPDTQKHTDFNNKNTNQMDYLFLKRKENEPLRESYYRSAIFIVKNNVLYFKRYSWGRINENLTERIPLKTAEVAEINNFLNHEQWRQNQKISESSIDEVLQLSYTVNLHADGKQYEQKIYGPWSYISNNQKQVDLLWRMLAHHTRCGKDVLPTPALNDNAIPEINLDLTISEEFRNKDSETKIRHYQLSGKKMTVNHIKKGKFKSEHKTEVVLTDQQYRQLYEYLKAEKQHLNSIHNPKTVKVTGFSFIPVMRGQLKANFSDQQYIYESVGGLYDMLENTSFIALEALEKILDPNGQMLDNFKQGLYDQRIKPTWQRFEK